MNLMLGDTKEWLGRCRQTACVASREVCARRVISCNLADPLRHRTRLGRLTLAGIFKESPPFSGKSCFRAYAEQFWSAYASTAR
jgi:hypothetical protein